MKTEKKQYRLKRWYPSLDVTLSVGNIIELTGRFKSFIGGGKYEFIHKTGDYSDVGFIKKCELNNPDFWELIEDEKPKPLFVTEDGFKFFSETSREFYIVVKFIKYRSAISDFEDQKKLSHKVFYHESNADKYIEENKPKPLFITDDGVEVFDRDGLVWSVRNNNFDKIKIHSIHLNDYDFEHKVFFHESNADEYIWKNKPVFSYEDMMKAKHSIILTDEDIEKAAKERVER